MNAITNVCIRHKEYERLYKLFHETKKKQKRMRKTPLLQSSGVEPCSLTEKSVLVNTNKTSCVKSVLVKKN